ncbi:hypothetical protein WR25_01343 [Diploscapter pachys]|uniref:Uncharacterized protein n=1 Tax=Diploscapter pachys TaxID=2018661 RepID=A0A2A2M5H9_9BILA|nr:hypothetical protein WR25_01343 [Diploscapter pachys]
MGPLTERQKAAVLATTQALAAQDRQIERNRQRQQLYIDALSQMRDIVRAATQDFARGDLGQPTTCSTACSRMRFVTCATR